jgi:hypothetical protein
MADFEELDKNPNDIKQKAIVDINPEWKFWQRALANIVNSIPVLLWAAVTYFGLSHFADNPELVGYRDAYMNLIMSAVAYSVLALIGGVSLLSWWMPWFSPRRMMQGTERQQLICVIFWAATILGLSIVIASIR